MLGRTRKELLATTTRGELFELMAYEKAFGFDTPGPGPPTYRRKPKSGAEQLAMFRAAFG